MAASKNKPEVEKGNTLLVAPSGAVTSVPESILEQLLESGYTKA